MTPAELDAIEARAKGATLGPWEQADDFYVIAPAAPADSPVTGEIQPVNAAFIAAARTDVPALVAEVRRLTAALVESRAAIVGALGRFGIADVAALKDGCTMVNFVELGRAIDDLDEALTQGERAAMYPVKP